MVEEERVLCRSSIISTILNAVEDPRNWESVAQSKLGFRRSEEREFRIWEADFWEGAEKKRHWREELEEEEYNFFIEFKFTIPKLLYFSRTNLKFKFKVMKKKVDFGFFLYISLHELKYQPRKWKGKCFLFVVQKTSSIWYETKTKKAFWRGWFYFTQVMINYNHSLQKIVILPSGSSSIMAAQIVYHLVDIFTVKSSSFAWSQRLERSRLQNLFFYFLLL